MAKKAKRRGRPPGSKNKKSNGTLAKDVGKMKPSQLRGYIAGLEETLAAKVKQQRDHLEAQLAELQLYTSSGAAAARAGMRGSKIDRRRSPEPKYQSRRDRDLKWSGRGLMPVWMREEMRGTKLTKDSFLIK
jgi:DNA-binding protein H-NS